MGAEIIRRAMPHIAHIADIASTILET